MITARLNSADPEDITRAAAILRDGGLVAFPTETVYGLGANALNSAAVEKIFAAKNRPHWDPLIVHVCNGAMLRRVVSSVPVMAERLMARNWPGPLTLLLPRTEAVPESVTAGRTLVGVRMPRHEVAMELLRQAGVPLAAPSANTFGHISPTTAEHVLADLDGRIDAVLDAGPSEVGLESTVAEVVLDGVIVYRPGGADLESDFSVSPPFDLGWVRNYDADESGAEPDSVPSPGVALKHYAPRARVVLVSPNIGDTQPLENLLVPVIDSEITQHGRVGVMLPDGWNASAVDVRYPWGAWNAHGVLAHRLYGGLRSLDEQGVKVIVCPVPQGQGIAEAIRDRLNKASR